MKRFRSAVVFGKFWPLHTGHLRLISEAIAASEQVSVVVDDGDEDVPADVRVTWLVEAFPTATVITAPDLCGHDTSDCTPSCSARYAEWLTAARYTSRLSSLANPMEISSPPASGLSLFG